MFLFGARLGRTPYSCRHSIVCLVGEWLWCTVGLGSPGSLAATVPLNCDTQNTLKILTIVIIGCENSSASQFEHSAHLFTNTTSTAYIPHLKFCPEIEPHCL